MNRRAVLSFPPLALLAACADDAGPQPAPGSPEADARDALLRPRTGDYRLGPGDKLRITVFNEEQLSGEQQVDPSGAVTMPLVGSITALGRTTREVSADLGRRLREGNFLRDPSVTVQLVETRPFYVLGEVQRPGEFRYRPGLTAPAAVAMAGGFTFRANQRRVLVARPGLAGEVSIVTGSTFAVEPGDVLRVTERFF